jgi:two-component system sensor histidine kinase HydH
VTNRIQGTGVGLASVAQVIEQHQGTITVMSEEGRGSSFTLYLPLTQENVTE